MKGICKKVHLIQNLMEAFLLIDSLTNISKTDVSSFVIARFVRPFPNASFNIRTHCNTFSLIKKIIIIIIKI